MFTKTRAYKVAKEIAQLKEDMLWFGALDNEQFNDWYVKAVQAQLLSGVDGDGNVMGFYSFATELITGGRKQEGDPYTLFDTGAFYSSMFTVITEQLIIFEADANKADTNLYDEYGANITKLNETNFEILKETVKNHYIKQIRELLSIT
jgi:hypothetical protein